jgi:hypothetical protein
MKVQIHELAVKEYNEAIQWYELQSSGLGLRFKKAVLEQIRNIKNNPQWYLKEDEIIFKVYIPKFSYKIMYTLESNKIIIWAVSHLHRHPGYWQNRKE